MGQRGLAKTPRLVGIVIRRFDRHRLSPRAPGNGLRPAALYPPAGHDCDALIWQVTQP
jgi:hypothetical protein